MARYPTGQLSEGETINMASVSAELIKVSDGIHVDMNHLKHGEVK